jgi:hypothetical protein
MSARDAQCAPCACVFIRVERRDRDEDKKASQRPLRPRHFIFLAESSEKTGYLPLRHRWSSTAAPVLRGATSRTRGSCPPETPNAHRVLACSSELNAVTGMRTRKPLSVLCALGVSSSLPRTQRRSAISPCVIAGLDPAALSCGLKNPICADQACARKKGHGPQRTGKLNFATPGQEPRISPNSLTYGVIKPIFASCAMRVVASSPQCATIITERALWR